MFYYVVFYSFDSDRQCIGPFSTEKEAWAAMEEDADSEYMIDKHENGWDAEVVKDRQSGEIVVRNNFYDRLDVTTWFIIEIKQ